MARSTLTIQPRATSWERVGDKNGDPLVIDGLWALQFGNGLFDQPTNSLFFTSGPEGEAHGLYGNISTVPEPSTLVIAGLGAALIAAGRVRRRLRARAARWEE